MQTKLLMPLVTTPESGRPGYVRTVNPFAVWSERLGRAEHVRVGFVFDKDSVPRWPVIYWLFKERLPKEAACIHDWLYERQPGITRHQADLVMRDLAAALGMPWYWRWPVYWGVRIGGGPAWSRYAAVSGEARP